MGVHLCFPEWGLDLGQGQGLLGLPVAQGWQAAGDANAVSPCHRPVPGTYISSHVNVWDHLINVKGAESGEGEVTGQDIQTGTCIN